MIFLIEYDRSRGQIVNIQAFKTSNRGTADKLRLQKELEQRLSPRQHEIVILEADSEEALRRTHRRYFEDLASLASGIATPPLPLATLKTE